MRNIRIYYSGDMQAAQTVILDAHAVNHLRVLRLQVGDCITLFNGHGGEFQATLQTITRQQVIALVGTYVLHAVESPLQIHLGQVISRGDKMDLTIQKAVELGVAQITPLFSERCGVKLDRQRLAKKVEHWRSIIISACEQSGRNYLPILHEPQLLADWLKQQQGVAAQQLNISLSPHATLTITQLRQQYATLTNANLVIGPEGGLTETELHMAAQHGFIPVKLGPRVLRTETAGLVAVAVLQSHWGDLV